MSYKNIPRKCSVCECCGSCDYEYEVENDCVSGDYSPLIGAIRQESREYHFDNGSFIKCLDATSENNRSIRGNAQVLALRTGRSLEDCTYALSYNKNDYDKARVGDIKT